MPFNRERARNLRRNMTDAERHLWRKLRRRNLDGCRFRRQMPIGTYIVDFVCLKRLLVIELDGSQHAERVVEDQARTAWLNSQGFKVIRFWNNSVFEELESVLLSVAQKT